MPNIEVLILYFTSKGMYQYMSRSRLQSHHVNQRLSLWRQSIQSLSLSLTSLTLSLSRFLPNTFSLTVFHSLSCYLSLLWSLSLSLCLTPSLTLSIIFNFLSFILSLSCSLSFTFCDSLLISPKLHHSLSLSHSLALSLTHSLSPFPSLSLSLSLSPTVTPTFLFFSLSLKIAIDRTQVVSCSGGRNRQAAYSPYAVIDPVPVVVVFEVSITCHQLE